MPILGGGGIRNAGAATVENSPFSGNSSQGYGGGILNSNANATLTLRFSTLSGNRAGTGGGGLFAGGTGHLTHCIVAGNFVGASPSDIAGGPVSSASHNLVGGASTAVGATNGNLILNSALPITSILDTNLAFNGGPTRTHRLILGSPAIDGGATNVATLPA